MFKQAAIVLVISLLTTFLVVKDKFALPFLSKEPPIVASEVREQIEIAFLDSWNDYSAHAWGYDAYGPITRKRVNMPRSGDPMGWMIIDTVDTMMLMYNSSVNHKDAFLEAITKAEDWINSTLNYDTDAEMNIFETTIRMLGGLLSAYHLSTGLSIGNPKVYLNKAIDIGDRLAMGFLNTEKGIPYSSVNLRTGQSVKNHVDEGASSTAEFTTLQLEFKYLSFVTGNASYWKLSEMVYPPLYEINNLLGSHYQGLVPIYTVPDTGRFYGENIRMGSRGDSFYEYLSKQYLMTGEDLYYKLYRASMDGMKKNLLGRSYPNSLTFIGEKPRGLHNPLDNKMDHLVCFLGGLLAMGATNGLPISEARNNPSWNAEKEDDWKLAQEFTYTCYQMYVQTPSGLSPEIVVFNDNSESMKNRARQESWWLSLDGDFYIKPLDGHNLQRPETVESIMFLYQLTKDEKYRVWGKHILESFLEHTSVMDRDLNRPKYVGLVNCVEIPTLKKDDIESFWLAETLKYLYLLFEDDVDLTKIVFNTEAHPFPVISKQQLMERGLKTGWTL